MIAQAQAIDFGRYDVPIRELGLRQLGQWVVVPTGQTTLAGFLASTREGRDEIIIELVDPADWTDSLMQPVSLTPIAEGWPAPGDLSAIVYPFRCARCADTITKTVVSGDKFAQRLGWIHITGETAHTLDARRCDTTSDRTATPRS